MPSLAASMVMPSDDPQRKRISMSNIAQPNLHHNNYCCNKGTFQFFGHFNPSSTSPSKKVGKHADTTCFWPGQLLVLSTGNEWIGVKIIYLFAL